MKKIILCLILFLNAALFTEEDIEKMLEIEEIKYETQEKKNEYKQLEAEAIKIKGQVFLRNQDSEYWVQLFEKDEIKEKSMIITMEKSEVQIRLKTGSVIMLEEKTRAVFEDLKQHINKENMTETGIKLFWGSVYSNVKKVLETGSKYEIRTNTATAGVRGTKFKVKMDKNGKSEVKVYEGRVGIFRRDKKGKEVFVEKNEKMQIENTGELLDKERHIEEPPNVDEEEKENGEEKNENENEKNQITETNIDLENIVNQFIQEETNKFLNEENNGKDEENKSEGETETETETENQYEEKKKDEKVKTNRLILEIK